MGGALNIVGIGPGSATLRTEAALAALAESDLVVGYKFYLGLISDLCAGKEIYGSSMKAETERAQYALEAARKGRRVAVVAGGDACVYGIGGLVLELMDDQDLRDIPVQVIPGISASVAAAALLGGPLMNDYVVISLSDLLTDDKLIRKRLRAAGQGDLAVALYNPQSRSRRNLLAEARKILLQYRPASVPVGVVRNAFRKDQSIMLCTLGDFDVRMEAVDMFSLVIIGDSRSKRKGPFIVTPRGYYTEETNGL